MVEAPHVLVGRYEIGELIGRGGMAEVYVGRDMRLNRTVAIKMLRPDLAQDPAFQGRFRREAQAAASLNHTAIVAVYDTGEDTVIANNGREERLPFIVMEYVEGNTLRDILKSGNPVPIEEAVEVTIGILSALQYAHGAGIVHRDIKPANVMITPTGAVKVMDFGIARAVSDTSQTMTQAVIGTAQYLSPEQARGEVVDTRSDLYSAGCLLFELLTGKPPFHGDSPVSIAYQHVREEPPLPSASDPDIPEPLDRICHKALAKERSARYQTAGEFRTDLEAFLAGRQVGAPLIGAAAAGTAIAADATRVMAPVDAAATTRMSPVPAAGASTSVLPPAQDDEEDGKHRKGWMWSLIALAILLIAGLAAFLIFQMANNDPPQVTVPKVVGMTEGDAAKKIESLELKVDRRDEFSTDVAKGRVTKTDPVADTKVDRNSTVIMYVSKGPETGAVPNLTGKSLEDATKALEDAGLVAGTSTTEDSATVPAGNVTRTDPKAGTKVTAGSTVNLFISNGKVSLKSYVGQSADDATKALSDLGLTVRINEQPDELKANNNKVTGQDPAGGSVPQGSTVTLTVAKNPQQISVPDVTGQSQQEAKAYLEARGFTVTVQQQPSTSQPGTVIMTSPTPNNNVQYGSPVTLIVSSGVPDPNNPDGN